MRRLVRAFRPLVALVTVLALTGCATINAHVDPWAREAGVTAGAPVYLYGQVGQVTIYGDGASEPLKVVIVENPDFSTAVGNAVRQSAAEARAGGSPTGSASWTRIMQYSPAVYLMQKQTHRLRIVRNDGREGTVVLEPRIGKGYFIVDWLLAAPTIFASLGVDWATGKWHVFDVVDVDAVVR